MADRPERPSDEALRQAIDTARTYATGGTTHWLPCSCLDCSIRLIADTLESGLTAQPKPLEQETAEAMATVERFIVSHFALASFPAIASALSILRRFLAQEPALTWRKLDPANDYGEPMVFRMPIVSNGEPDVDYWVDTVRERESEDEDGNVRGVYYDLTEDHGWDIAVVEAEALCIALSALSPAPKGGSDG